MLTPSCNASFEPSKVSPANSGGIFLSKETVTIIYKELDRIQIIQESVNHHITQEQAAVRIGISIRLDKRLVHR